MSARVRKHLRMMLRASEAQQERDEVLRGIEALMPDEFERDRALARITISCYGCITLSPPFYFRHVGLNDRCFSTADSRRDTMPDVIRRGRKG